MSKPRYRLTVTIEGADRLQTILSCIAGECSGLEYQQLEAPGTTHKASTFNAKGRQKWALRFAPRLLDTMKPDKHYRIDDKDVAATFPELSPNTVKGLFPLLAHAGKLIEVSRGTYRKP